MTLFAPMWWIFRVWSIFEDFDFTDKEDFTPLVTLLVGLTCAACIFLWPKEKRTASPVLMTTTLLLSLWPLLPNPALFFLAREFERVNGAWPQVMMNDPKLLHGNVSVRYENLYLLVTYLEAFSGAWMIIFLALIVQQGAFSATQRRFVIRACIASMVIFVLDFGGLYSWWLD